MVIGKNSTLDVVIVPTLTVCFACSTITHFNVYGWLYPALPALTPNQLFRRPPVYFKVASNPIPQCD